MVGAARSMLRRAIVEIGAAIGVATRGMAANRMRALLSVLGIAIGVATLSAIYAITTGLQVAFAEQVSQLGANTLYISSRPMVMMGDWWRYRNRPKLTDREVEALRADAPLLEAIAPVMFWMADVGYLDEHVLGVQVRGTNDEYLETANLKIARGRFMSAIEVELGRPVVVLGADVVDGLFAGADPIGARVRVGDDVFTVVGTLMPKGKSFGESLDSHVVIPIKCFRVMFGRRRDMTIVATTDPARFSEAEEQVTEVLRRVRGLQASQPDNFSVMRSELLVKFFEEQTSILFNVAIAVGLITLLVGGIGVMNIMLVAVTERTREVGVRRALGARKRTILVQFLLEAALVTMVGGAIGTVLGLGGAQMLSMVTPLSASTPPETILMALGFSALVGLIFGTWPAWRAANLDPIESLRYE